MFSRKIRTTVFAAAATACAALSGSPASAAVINAWNFNLSEANGVAWTNYVSGSTTVCASCLGDATNIDHINVQGISTIIQNELNGSPIGQSFTDSGVLQLQDYVQEAAVFTTNFVKDSNYVLFFNFTGLTGVFNPDHTITFDAGSGAIQLVLQDQSTGNTLDLADFAIVDPSGGSNINFFGGAGPTATIDISLLETAGVSGLYTDSSDNELPLNLTLHLGNVNALLDPNFDPNPSCTEENSDGVSQCTLHVTNGGQYNLATVPEPGTLGLLGAGLALMGFGFRSRRQKSA